jgi:adenylate kinase family enzyme
MPVPYGCRWWGENDCMKGVLLLAGPPAVGHNTVAALIANRYPPVAVVDGDDLRAMVTHPAAPDGGPAWERQYDLCVRNLCAIAANFDRAGLATILLDVVEPRTVPLYRALLAEVSRFDLVLLTADNDHRIDTTRHTPDQTVQAVLKAITR